MAALTFHSHHRIAAPLCAIRQRPVLSGAGRERSDETAIHGACSGGAKRGDQPDGSRTASPASIARLGRDDPPDDREGSCSIGNVRKAISAPMQCAWRPAAEESAEKCALCERAGGAHAPRRTVRGDRPALSEDAVRCRVPSRDGGIDGRGDNRAKARRAR
jgi:hypothetical protein